MLQTLRYCSNLPQSLTQPLVLRTCWSGWSYVPLSQLVAHFMPSPSVLWGMLVRHWDITLRMCQHGCAHRSKAPILTAVSTKITWWYMMYIRIHIYIYIYIYITYMYVCIYMSNIAQPNYSPWFWSLSFSIYIPCFFSIQPLLLSQRWPRRAPRSRCSDSQLIPMMEVWNGTWWNRYPRTWDFMGLEWDKNIWVCLKLGYNKKKLYNSTLESSFNEEGYDEWDFEVRYVQTNPII